ncbi:MAG: putative MFS-type transporter [Ktedonobacterales bacterium]|jgi:MFS family permease|nr:MAG: putative MFS-type transporter [Ktedonobacterales bacterium]
MLSDLLARFRALQRNARLYLISNAMQAPTAGAAVVLYTLYLNALGYSTKFIGIVTVVGAIGAALGIVIASPLAHRAGYRAFLLWSNFIGGFSIAAQLIVPTPPVVLVTTLGVGISLALFLVINTPLLTTYSTAEQRISLFGLNNALVFLATIIGTLLGGFLPGWFLSAEVQSSAWMQALQPLLVSGAKAQAYELALLATGVIAVPSIIPVFMMREEPRKATAATGSAGDDMLAPPLRARMGAWLRAVRVGAVGVAGRFAVAEGLVGFGAGIFFPYANLYFVNQLGVSTAYFGVLTTVYSVAIAVAALVAIPLARRWGTMRTGIAAQVASLPFLVAIGAFPVVVIASLAYLIRGFLMAVTTPPLQTYLMGAVPDKSRVNASSAYNVSFQVGGALGAGVGGWLIALAGYQASFFAAMPFYALSAVLLIVWFGFGARRRD